MTGNDLRDRRLKLNLRQEDLARELEVVVSSVARWEQMKDKELPNSKMLDLAVKTIEGDFLIYSLNKDKENQIFSREHQLFLRLFPQLNDSMDEILKQIKPDDRDELLIYMLCRLCVRHFEAIFLLCSNGHGFAAMRSLRSMFEKTVDAHYLNANRKNIDDFVNYHFVNLKKTGFEDIAKRIDPAYEKVVEGFVNPSTKKVKPSWANMDLVSRAKSVGCDDWLINNAYRISNEFVHSSMGEILMSLIVEVDGTISAVEDENLQERDLGHICFRLSCQLLNQTLNLLVETFKVPKHNNFKQYLSEFEEMYTWTAL